MKICTCRISKWLSATCSAQNFEMHSATHGTLLFSGTISSCIMSHPITLNDVTILLSSPWGVTILKTLKERKIYSVEKLTKYKFKKKISWLTGFQSVGYIINLVSWCLFFYLSLPFFPQHKNDAEAQEERDTTKKSWWELED